MKGSLCLLGLGLDPLAHPTLETLEAAWRCSRVHLLGLDPKKVRPLFSPGAKLRAWPRASAWTSAVLKDLRAGHTVGLASPGHPYAFDPAARRLPAACEKLGLAWESFGAISAAGVGGAALGAVLGLEVQGLQSVEAASLASSRAPDFEPDWPLFVHAFAPLKPAELGRAAGRLRAARPEARALPESELRAALAALRPSDVFCLPGALGGDEAGELERRADASFSAGLRSEALKAYEAALALRPEASGLRIKAALVLRDLGYLKAALVQLRKVGRGEKDGARARTLMRELDRSAAVPRAGRARRARPYPAVGVDPRLELLGVLLALSGEGAGAASPYRERVLERFGRFKAHPAVRSLRAERQAGLGLVGAQRSLLRLSAPPALRPRDGADGEARRPALLDSLRDFAKESDFAAFFKEEAGFYRVCREGVLAQTAGRDYGGLMEEYSGLAVEARYELHLCPLNPPEARLNHLFWEPERRGWTIHSTVAPERWDGDRPVFDYEELRWYIWHELGHCLLDDALEAFRSEVERTEPALGPAASGHYGSWAQSLREHFAQGLACRMVDWAREQGKAPPGPPPPPRPLPYLDLVLDSLKDYERRGRRGGLRAHFPRLMAAFSELAQKRGSKTGPSMARPAELERDAIL